MKRIVVIVLMVMGLVSIVNAEPECRLRGCVHDGGDVVLIFSIDNDENSPVDCRLEKGGLNSVSAEGMDGRTFTDINFFVGSRCVYGEKGSKVFAIPAKGSDLVSMVVSNVPKDVDEFRKVTVLLKYDGDKGHLYDFERVPVLGEMTAKLVK